MMLITKPTRVTRMKAAAIYHIFTKSIIDRNFKTTVIESDVQTTFLFAS